MRAIRVLGIFAVAIACFLTFMRFTTRAIPFDSVAWRKGAKHLRFQMAKHLSFKEAVVGRLQSEVHELLGPPKDLEPWQEGREFDSYWLDVRFDPFFDAVLIVGYENGTATEVHLG